MARYAEYNGTTHKVKSRFVVADDGKIHKVVSRWVVDASGVFRKVWSSAKAMLTKYTYSGTLNVSSYKSGNGCVIYNTGSYGNISKIEIDISDFLTSASNTIEFDYLSYTGSSTRYNTMSITNAHTNITMTNTPDDSTGNPIHVSYTVSNASGKYLSFFIRNYYSDGMWSAIDISNLKINGEDIGFNISFLA